VDVVGSEEEWLIDEEATVETVGENDADDAAPGEEVPVDENWAVAELEYAFVVDGSGEIHSSIL
jgi:hypothetical protein